MARSIDKRRSPRSLTTASWSVLLSCLLVSCGGSQVENQVRSSEATAETKSVKGDESGNESQIQGGGSPSSDDVPLEFIDRLNMARLQLSQSKLSDAEATVETLKSDYAHPEYRQLVEFLADLEEAKKSTASSSQRQTSPADDQSVVDSGTSDSTVDSSKSPSPMNPAPRSNSPSSRPVAETAGELPNTVSPETTPSAAAETDVGSSTPTRPSDATMSPPNDQWTNPLTGNSLPSRLEPISRFAEQIWLYDELERGSDTKVATLEASTSDVRRAIDRTKRIADASDAIESLKSFIARHSVSTTDLRRLENQIERLSEKAAEGLFRNGVKWQTREEYVSAKQAASSRLKAAAAACTRGDFKTGLVELEAAAKADSLDPTAPFIAGLILSTVEANAIESAQESFEMVLDRRPGDISALHNRAIVLMRQGEFDTALRLLELVSERAPWHPQLAANTARAASLGEMQILPVSPLQATSFKGLLSKLTAAERMPKLPAPRGWLFAPATISKSCNSFSEDKEMPFETWEEPAGVGFGIAVGDHYLLCLKPVIQDSAQQPCMVIAVGDESLEAVGRERAQVVAFTGDESIALVKTDITLQASLPIRPSLNRDESYVGYREGQPIKVSIDKERSAELFPLYLDDALPVGSPILDAFGGIVGITVPELDAESDVFDPEGMSTRCVSAASLAAFISSEIANFETVATPLTSPNSSAPEESSSKPSEASPPMDKLELSMVPIRCYELKTDLGVRFPRSITNPLEDLSCPHCSGIGAVDCPDCVKGKISVPRRVKDFYSQVRQAWVYSTKVFPEDCPSCRNGQNPCPVCRGARYAVGN